ncbi:cytochrome P450 [Pseudomonas sp. Fl4BN1]|uniref:cytochrome P450 n=1 Tax=Pseudomonas sp. Fl4BN1 TaxID=2697651 RepID=UPI001378192F|nr:cytochrome P450 [Pseudomonas sp. Fl4BN1]NBF09155.1 cytochrome P450 [Pseudomonas sp. Fl4BN1]
MDPISAATHFDPYDFYYARLRARGGLTYESRLGLWVASSAAAVAAVLNHPACHVRPPHEAVPKAIAGSPAGALFGRLLRMNDGPRHSCPRATLEPALQALADCDLQPYLYQWQPALTAPVDAADLQRWQLRLPVALVAALLGVPAEQREDLARRTGEFVACFSPLSDQAHLHTADLAAHDLSQQMQALLDAPQPSPLLRAILQRRGDLDQQDLRANLVGLLAQTHDACAGLIGNSLVTLLANPALCQRLRHDPSQLSGWLLEKQRLDPPVQNTRRFVIQDCTLNGVSLQAGDAVLVLLAAANHDPAIAAVTGTDPARQGFSFGAGAHQCPGRELALNIVQTLLHGLLQSTDLSSLSLDWQYQASVNGRIPRFSDSAQARP